MVGFLYSTHKLKDVNILRKKPMSKLFRFLHPKAKNSTFRIKDDVFEREKPKGLLALFKCVNVAYDTIPIYSRLASYFGIT